MYKENGDLNNNEAFKALQDHKSGGEALRVNPSNPLDKASGFDDAIIPQSEPFASANFTKEQWQAV